MFNFLKRKPKFKIVCPDYEIRPSSVHEGREHLCFPDGLRIIVEDGKYVGFYTQNPCDK